MKKVIFTVGLPGSGKSSLAEKLKKEHLDNGLSCEIFTTDDFFMVNNEYKFAFNYLSVAHEWNFGNFGKAMLNGMDVLIVANCNLNAWTLYKYVELAIKNGYDFELIEPKTKWKNDIEECAKRNTHGVPLATIERMHNKRESVKDIEKDLKNKFDKLKD